LTTRHGRSAIAVLVFQDLASVPLLALVAIWARGDATSIGGVVLEVLGVLLLFGVSAIIARRLLHTLLSWVARLEHEEAFVLVSLCVVVAAASAAHALGVSAALGAFLAGMVLGESDFRHHMEEHLKPFRDVLSGLFFVTVGLQLDVGQIVSAPLRVLAWLLAWTPIKIGLNFLALRMTRLSSLDAWRTGIVLGHGGEFALLLLGMVLQQRLIEATVVQPMLVALVLSMALAPVLIRHHDWLVSRLSHSGFAVPLPQAEEGDVATQAQALSDHVIVCGAGELGLALSQTLRLAGVSHLLLESDTEQAATARATGAPVVYGDASRPDTLNAAGLSQARLVVVTFPHPQSASRIAWAVRQHHPALPVVVVCWREREALALKELPNVHVYEAATAPALGLAERVMRLGGVPVSAANGAPSSMRQTTTT
jgi:CPA2 family monovalent cation:H+ antiporter-2